jgi:hypothetical protein
VKPGRCLSKTNLVYFNTSDLLREFFSTCEPKFPCEFVFDSLDILIRMDNGSSEIAST